MNNKKEIARLIKMIAPHADIYCNKWKYFIQSIKQNEVHYFDLAIALHYYCEHYHGGFDSWQYKTYCLLEFKPGLSCGLDSEPIAKKLYDDLVLVCE